MHVATAAQEEVPPHGGPPPEADRAEEDMRHYRRALQDLLGKATVVTDVLHQHITALPPPSPAAPAGPAMIKEVVTLAGAFDRAARTVRRTIHQGCTLGEAKAPTSRPGRQRIAARKRILRDVEDVIQRRAEGSRAERLHAELLERLDSPDLEDEIDTRPVAEIIADLCRDLGLAHVEGTHPWKRRTPADVAALCARAARPCSAASRPVPPDPGPANPGTADPALAGTGPVGPGPADPLPADPLPADPGPADPGPADRAPTDPGPACVCTGASPPDPDVDYAALDDAALEAAALDDASLEDLDLEDPGPGSQVSAAPAPEDLSPDEPVRSLPTPAAPVPLHRATPSIVPSAGEPPPPARHPGGIAQFRGSG